MAGTYISGVRSSSSIAVRLGVSGVVEAVEAGRAIARSAKYEHDHSHASCLVLEVVLVRERWWTSVNRHPQASPSEMGELVS